MGIVYIDGEFFSREEAKVSVYDHGYLYGDGLFEGIRVYNGEIFECKAHIDRLYNGARALALDIPLSKEEMTAAMLETCKRSGLSDAYIRLVVSRGPGDLGISPQNCEKPTVVIIVDTIQLYPREMYDKGMAVITAATRRNSPAALDPQLKSLNYLNNILAKIEANFAGVPEAIMLNQNGYVCECTGDNLFVVKDGAIYTPPVHLGALNGITRGVVLRLAKKLGIEAAESEMTLYNLYSADEVFLSGTAAEIIGVTKIDNRPIADGAVGPMTRKLMENFKTAF